MNTPNLDSIRNCLDGAIPGAITTVAPDGMPNLARISQVDYVDSRHVALSFQFFNKTRENILANPCVQIEVVDPDTTARYSLDALYLRTETAGPLFESMKAKLAGIASLTGMSKVFRLLGADIYEVQAIHPSLNPTLPAPLPSLSLLPALRSLCGRLTGCVDLASLMEELLHALQAHLAIDQAMLLMYDASGDRLYTVASRGYTQSGVGSEIPLGAGVIGMAARQRCPIRINHWSTDYAYSQAVRKSLQASDIRAELETEIPLPGLAAPNSQLAIPFPHAGQLLGVLYVESPLDARFSYETEDALAILMQQFVLAMSLLQQTGADKPEDVEVASRPASASQGQALLIRRFAANDSVFIGDDYLIKGVAGAIFWKLLLDYQRLGRTDFSNRELRLDPSIRLPDISDNLEARLILLQRRLLERDSAIVIEKTGRGRFRLNVPRPLQLLEVAAPPR
jgi:adenylate cyclase